MTNPCTTRISDSWLPLLLLLLMALPALGQDDTMPVEDSPYAGDDAAPDDSTAADDESTDSEWNPEPVEPEPIPPAPIQVPVPQPLPPAPVAVAPTPLPAPTPAPLPPTPPPAETPPVSTVDSPPPSPAGRGAKGFSKVSVSPQVGYAFFPESSYDYEGFTLTMDQRNAFTAKLHLDIGGDGLAFELAPLFSMEAIGSNIADIGSDLSAGAGGKLFAVGGQLGLVYRASWKSFYPHIGIGIHSTYVMGDSIQYGTELYGRIPAGFTIYAASHFAFVVEVAFLYGATGLRYPDPDTAELAAQMQAEYNVDISTIDWQNTSPEQLQADYDLTDEELRDIVNEEAGKVFKFGQGPGFEALFGIRFP